MIINTSSIVDNAKRLSSLAIFAPRRIERSSSTILTPDQVRAEFASDGKTFAEWADEHGFDRANVYKVLNGMVKGRRGEGHRIAVALRLKASASA
jgi:gp16 family phage-associated protein